MRETAEANTSRLMDSPPEPKALYPEPSLDAVEGLAIIRGTTFFAATRRGNLTPPSAPQVGLFCDDTRFLSYLELRVNGQPQGGTKIVPVYSQEFTDSLDQPKPIEDADLVKAIDITFKRLGAYLSKTDAAPAPVQNNYLYRPQWLQVAR